MPVFNYGVRNGKVFAELLPALKPDDGIDDRIKRIDIARENLLAGLSAIEELKDEAQSSNEKVIELRGRLEELASKREVADAELQEIKRIASSDVEAFQKIAGVPSRAEVAKERLVGFVLGILASLIATAILHAWLIVAAWP